MLASINAVHVCHVLASINAVHVCHVLASINAVRVCHVLASINLVCMEFGHECGCTSVSYTSVQGSVA